MPAARDADARERARCQRTIGLLTHYKRDLAERLAETKRLFERPVYAVDIHSHSVHSDGRGTVRQNHEGAANAGLDFFFATDHHSLQQKRALRSLDRMSYGQEPGAGPHHMGLLHPERLFKPRGDSLRDDYERACVLAPFVWIPHPAGWYPVKWYTDEQIAKLWELPDEFAMEVINGAGKIVQAYDGFDAKAVGVWDRLLGDGRKVTALGGSDAHGPDEFGTVWTGIYADECAADALIEGLRRGRCFASEAALLDFTCNGEPLGATVAVPRGAALELRFRAADSAGLACARIVSDGKVLKEFAGRGEPVLAGTLTRKAAARPRHYRLETVSSDARRAFSTPIYVEPA